MGYPPYFDFGGQEFHFGYHVVLACGYNPETRLVLIADRDEVLHPVLIESSPGQGALVRLHLPM